MWWRGTTYYNIQPSQLFYHSAVSICWPVVVRGYHVAKWFWPLHHTPISISLSVSIYVMFLLPVPVNWWSAKSSWWTLKNWWQISEGKSFNKTEKWLYIPPAGEIVGRKAAEHSQRESFLLQIQKHAFFPTGTNCSSSRWAFHIHLHSVFCTSTIFIIFYIQEFKASWTLAFNVSL